MANSGTAKRGRNRYTDEFRASAVLMLMAAGYPDRLGSLTHVADKLSVPARTLSRWAKAENNPPPAELVIDKRVDLVEMLRDEAYNALREMGEARQDASYRELATAVGIFVDKIQLLTGQATERHDVRQMTVSFEWTDEQSNYPDATAA